jgi:hypothetical protein
VAGVVGLLLSRHAIGPFTDLAHRHGANLSFSFAAFFLLRMFPLPGNTHSWATALYTLAALSAQELAQRLGLHPGTFDPRDFLFDAIGVLVAWAVHQVATSRSRQAPLDPQA